MALSTSAYFGTQGQHKRYSNREVIGDQSEAGLIRFLTPVLMKEYGGDFESSDHGNTALD